MRYTFGRFRGEWRVWDPNGSKVSDHPNKLTHDEAVKIGVFDRHEAIEYALHRKEISDALILIGGEPLNDIGYWLSEATEFSTSSAWFYGGSSGGLYYNTKRTNYFVRAVSALKDFPLNF